ncbi:acyltransferase family protein [Cellulophaga baltica]|uniref:acyltransferase family protein n=1 Tax=Cellulophaga baltica TaxID=76594 RepID=UPI0024954F16|nr:acyltransferase family protein [Cellulophaga baltica]
MKKNIDNFNILRCIGISLVVLRHTLVPFVSDAWPLETIYNHNQYLVIFGKYVSSFSMPLFVFISGFIFSYLRINLNKYKTTKIFIQKKIKRLIVPFVILAPIYILVFYKVESISDFLFYLQYSPGHFWFLIMLFIIFIIFYQFEDFFKNKIKLGIIVTLSLFILYPIFAYFKVMPIANTFKYLPFFYMGYLFYYHDIIIEKHILNKKKILLFAHLILFSASLYFLQFNSNESIFNKIFGFYHILPLGILATLILYTCFANIQKLNNAIMNNIVLNINQNSYYIYIIHQPLLIVYYNSELISNSPYLLIIPLGFLISVIVSILISKILNRFLLGRMLIGATS